MHDALIDPRVLKLGSPAAKLIDVGKRCGGRRTDQERIHEILVEEAQRADTVVRLKGGDPFVFGRGGEEALALRVAGVPFVVVPGVTAGIGATAYAGIPATQRGVSSSVTLVSGHAPETSPDGVRWRELAAVGGTIVVYMGVGRLRHIARELIAGGLSPVTPAAVVEWGTYDHQRTITAPLAALPLEVEAAGVGAPAVLVVGDVVALRQQAAWFDERPLAGRRVLLARARAQRSRLAGKLRAAGAEVLEYPRLRHRRTTGAVIPLTPDRWDWLVLTSVGAVAWLLAELVRQGRDIRALQGIRLAALGSATSGALRRRGIVPEVSSPTYAAEDVVSLFPDVAGRRVLLPRARGAASAVGRALAQQGARIVEVEPFDDTQVEASPPTGSFDAVVLASSSSAAALAGAAGVSHAGAVVAAIGPSTARSARELGFDVALVAEDHTTSGLVAALAQHMGSAPARGVRPRQVTS